MRLNSLRWPLRSMFGQLLLLTLILTGIGVYFFAIRPIQAALPPAAFDPLDVTTQQVSEAIGRLSRELKDNPKAQVPADFRQTMADVVHKNPGFRYYIRVGTRVVSNAAAPRYFAALGLDAMEKERAKVATPDFCMQLYRNLTDASGRSAIQYLYCDTPNYQEYSGIQHPIATKIDRSERAYSHFFWAYSSGFLYTVGALFALVVLVILINMVMIRRVARVASSFDVDTLGPPLPEQGVPQEVVPLVRATNVLIERLRDAQAQQKFFLSAAAHELRTPLTVLRTRMEMLDDGAVKDKLIADVRRMTDLVNQLLTLMKVRGLREVGGELDLVASTRKVIAELSPVAARRDIALHFSPAIERYPVVGGTELVEVAIANLIDNAISFTPQAGEVFVSLDADGRLAVRDLGPGLDPATAESLFEPFVRYPANRKGHGLGLAIVKAIATLHGGTVTAMNADGAGAVFELWLPNKAHADRPSESAPAKVRIPPFRATAGEA